MKSSRSGSESWQTVSLCDAHVHVGYFDRKGFDAPFYYSPRRICTVMKKCGVEEFVYSSTSMQTHGVVFADVHREMREVKKLFGAGAHPFLWVTGAYLKEDPTLSALDMGFYEGVKLHGLETDWLNSFSVELESVLSKVEIMRLPVMVHTCGLESSRPLNWLSHAQRHESVNFNFAHGCPIAEAIICLREARNVFVDTACMSDKDLSAICETEVCDRILWGTDFPTLSAKVGDSRLTADYRRSVEKIAKSQRECFARAFRLYLKGRSL